MCFKYARAAALNHDKIWKTKKEYQRLYLIPNMNRTYLTYPTYLTVKHIQHTQHGWNEIKFPMVLKHWRKFEKTAKQSL